ncbi:MAG TPA: DUF1573 domain-containing protein [Chitinophagales bacterium]|nr:DUF1573 domain-containing protein [Chitinophagales bacterium]
MKNIVLTLLAVALLAGIIGCRKKGEPSPEFKIEAEAFKDTTLITFIDSVTFHFDTIMQDDKVEHTFRLVNSGDKNLLITRAFGSCGCTVPEYPKDPVKPGDTASIHVTFNSAGKKGDQHKNVTLVCNTAVRNEMVYLSGFVKTEDDK